MMTVMGDRELLLARELTKKFEEKMRGRISEVAEAIKDRSLKGEIVLVVRGRKDV
jgi:16S rRNA (cytidine1402-2'-O)-methyltransferase